MQRRLWNKADKTLFAAAVLFMLALCAHLVYRHNLWAEGALFSAEAALVGGIADWFAVTALFRKPLGFPYHTAILPRRRIAFIESSVTMVQKEFFSKRKIFQRIRGMKLLALLLGWLGEKETQAMLIAQLLHYARAFLLHMDRKAQAQIISRYFRKTIMEISPEEIFRQCGKWLRLYKWDKRLLIHTTVYLREKAATPQTRMEIEHLLEEYQTAHTSGVMGSLFVGLAHAVNIVNYEEIAALIQQQLLELIDTLSEPDSEQQRQVLELLSERVSETVQSEEFLEFFLQLRTALMRRLPLEEMIERNLTLLREKFMAEEKAGADIAALPVLRPKIIEVLEIELEYCIKLLRENKNLQREIDRLLYDIAARSALQAQTMVGVVVRSVLERLTDEQMNRLVYDKVEPDLLWIRMNGSIVGFGIGLCLFLVLQVL
jgi:uncharacterized membrane-anchored protein YjiN (DUF445 family)